VPEQLGQVDLVVEALAGCPVLSEGVAGDEYLVLDQVAEHAVGPVQHPGFEELHRPLAKA